MAVQTHLVARLQEVYVVKHDLHRYVQTWNERIASPELATRVRQTLPVLDAQVARLARCLDRLGAVPDSGATSPLVDTLRWQDTAALEQMPHATPLDHAIRYATTALAIGGMETNVYEAMLAMSEALNLPEITEQLRMNLAQDEQDLIAMRGLLDSLIADAAGGGMRRAA